MLVYKPVTVDQYDELFQLMEADAVDYLNDTLRLMQLTKVQFAQLFRTVGKICTINQDDHLAGFYWIEEREDVLHLHGLILQACFQGQGIGTEVVRMLIDRYQGQMDAIELGVHQSNPRAQKLYHRLGFEVVKFRDELGYYIMQKPLARKPSGRCSQN
jgi:ribosomal protein S18 acetylase RimI-like enzyme